MTIRAGDVMQTAVRTVDADLSLADLEDILLRHQISGAPVLEHGVLVGIISRSDIVRALTLERALTGVVSDFYRQISDESGEPTATAWHSAQGVEDHLTGRRVRDAMTPELITVEPGTPISTVARLMLGRHIHRVLVTDGQRLLGLISSSDLIRLIADARLRAA
jgi:CBS domain-containing protein